MIGPVEETPELDDLDELILDEIWDGLQTTSPTEEVEGDGG